MYDGHHHAAADGFYLADAFEGEREASFEGFLERLEKSDGGDFEPRLGEIGSIGDAGEFLVAVDEG